MAGAERPRDRQFSNEDEAKEREALGRCGRQQRCSRSGAALHPAFRIAEQSGHSYQLPRISFLRTAVQNPTPPLPAPAIPTRIVFAFSAYGPETEAEISRWAATYAALPPRHRALLAASLPAKLAAARAAARTNRQFLDAMLAGFDEENEGGAAPAHLSGARGEAARIAGASGGRCPPGDVEKVCTSVA